MFVGSVLKSKDIALPTKVTVKALVFLVVMYGCESCTIKTAECRRIDAFELWCWRRLLRVPCKARRSNQSIKEINPEYLLDWSWSSSTLATWCKGPTYWKRPWCWERLKTGGEGTTEDEIVGCHQWLNGHEFEQAPGVSNGQGSLACCSPWRRKESDTTEWLNWLVCARHCAKHCTLLSYLTLIKNV